MNRPPAMADLLEVARETLRSRIQPRLEAEDRYAAAMIARAMQLAAREIAIGADMRERERAALTELYGEKRGLDELRARLSRELRMGALDNRREDVERALEMRIESRLAITDPGYR